MNLIPRNFFSCLTAAGIIVSLFAGQAQAAPPLFCTGTTTTVANGGSVTAAFLLTPGNCVEAGDKFFGAFSVTGAITGTGSASFSFQMTPGNVTLGFLGTVNPGSVGSLNYTVAVDPALSQGLINDLQKDFTLNAAVTGLPASANLQGATIPASIVFNCNRTVNPSGGSCPQTAAFAPVSQLAVNETLITGGNAVVTALTDTISEVSPGSTLSDSEQPGSVIVYPKVVGGAPGVAGSVAQVNVDGNLVSFTEIEIGAVCPAGATCTPHQPVVVQFHWVCPGVNSICPETSFQVVLSVDGKLAFSADGIAINTNSPRVPPPPCPRGYLIGWVVNQAGVTAVPIKFDGLVGNAVVRGASVTVGGVTGSTGVSAYQAVTIQANPVDAPGARLNTPLDFDGLTGGYSQVTGVQIGDLKFDRTVSSSSTALTPDVLSETFLDFLTLDVVSGRANSTTFVPYLFFNESAAAPSTTNPLFENVTDGTLHFVCWTQLNLATISGDFGGPIDASLTQAFQGTRKGLVIAGPASNGAGAPVTLIGLIETVEGTAANNFQERRYNYLMQNNSVGVPTTFVP